MSTPVPLKTVLLLILVGSLVQGGCATHDWSPLDAAALRARRPTSLVEILDETPTFTARPLLPMGGIVSIAVAKSLGDRVVKENGVVDPTRQVMKDLSHSLASAFNLQVRFLIQSDADTPDSAFNFRGADLAVRVRTVEWSYGTNGSDWSHLWAFLHMHVSLLDARKTVVIAEGDCQNEPPKQGDGPTADQLMANSAAILKQQLKDAADRCLDYFRRCLLASADQTASGTPACPEPGHYPGAPSPNHQSVDRRK